MKLTQKQIGFTQDYFSEVPPGQAYMTHYKVKNMAVADVCASKLLKTTKISAYLQELRLKAESKLVMSKQEILERHSEIARAKITDFQTTGADGSWIDIGPENKHAGAIQEITSRTEYDKDGSNPSVVMKVKLHDPVRSMQEIAKLQGHYPKEGTGEGDRYYDIKVLIVRERPREVLESTRKPLEIESNGIVRGETETDG